MPDGKPRKPTPNQQEWQKQIKRIQRLLKKAEAQGTTRKGNGIKLAQAPTSHFKITQARAITARNRGNARSARNPRAAHIS